MKRLLTIACFQLLIGCTIIKAQPVKTVVGAGQMPQAVTATDGTIHVVYGNGDSVMYSYSKTHGRQFTRPSLVARIPRLAASHMRGPQIAAGAGGVTIIAANKDGDIFSFTKTGAGSWQRGQRVNDRDTVSKEGLMSLAGSGPDRFAVWLDLRDRHNKLFGARSSDGGKTWSKNILVYASPDKTVCECCKPSVVMRGKDIYVMFRNWLNGNRDLYLAHSDDKGLHFQQPKKLGYESWALNACPMDGGGLVIDQRGNARTVWRRKDLIYASQPGSQEMELGRGRVCTLTLSGDKEVYAWMENGDIVVLQSGHRQNLGKGMMPALTSVDAAHVVCIWENNGFIESALVNL